MPRSRTTKHTRRILVRRQKLRKLLPHEYEIFRRKQVAIRSDRSLDTRGNPGVGEERVHR